VVDNASSDGSPEAAQREFPNVMLVRNGGNLGFAKANNIGIQKSNGRYLCLINPDVILNRGCLDRMCAYMDGHPSIGILGPQILNPDSTIQLSCRGFPSLWNALCRAVALDTMFPRCRLFGSRLMNYWAHDTVRRVDVLSGCFWMISRATLNDVGLLEEDFFMYAEDTDYCRRCWQKGWEVVYLPAAKAVHYGGVSSSHAPNRFQVEMLNANLQYWRRYHSLPAQAAFVAITLLHQVLRIFQGVVLYLITPSERQRISTKIRTSVTCSLWLLRSSSPTHGGTA
jgi:hypothetical protein